MSKLPPIIRITLLCLFLLFVGLGLTVSAQQFTGTIQGVVQDSTGAVVTGAEVSVINIATGETRIVTTDGNGAYTAPQLKPALYRVIVKKAGFKAATLDEIKLDVQQIRAVDVKLDVGQSTETVSVTASGAATIETVSSTVSQTIENKRVVDLPLNGRDPFSLVNLSPGVIPAPGSSPFISGGRNATSEVAIDGITNVNAENNVSILDFNYRPSVDAVQEFSVQTNSVSAEFGRLGGGVINLVTKSGANQFHFTAFEFHRNSALDANNFFSNRAGIGKGSFKRNQFGGNIGGPVIKDKTFFFANYEGDLRGQANVGTFTAPTQAWRNGDFRGLKNTSGADIIIYDPLTTKADGTRDQISCNGVLNVICPERQSVIARNLLKFWPMPNTPSTNQFTAQNNFVASGTNINNNHRIDSRVDHNFSQNIRSFVRFSRLFQAVSRPFNHFGNLATPNNAGPVDDTATSVSADTLYTVNPTLFLNVRYGLSRRTAKRTPFSSGFDFTQLGFPSALKSVADALEFPRFDINGVSSLGQETFNDLIIAPTTHSLNVNATKTLTRHTFKFGMDYRKLMLNFLQLSQPAGQYTFNQSWTQRVFNQGSATAGFGFATFLLGIPGNSNSTSAGGGTLSHDPTPASSSPYWAWYFEDTWKYSPKLTLTLGLRYDLDIPRTERFDRYGVFDFDATSPIATQVPANPFFNPANLRGAVNFVTADDRRQVPTDKNNFGPRIGFAYNITDRTVVRAAYGIYYSASAYQAAGHTGSSGMVGFRTASQMVVSLDGRVPVTFLDNPFPNGFNLPTGKSQGASTRLGLSVGGGDGGVFPDNGSPYIQQWNLNVQRELPANIVFEAAYIGSKGTRLLAGESGLNLNQLQPSFLSLGSQLTQPVANPFFGIFTNPTSNLRFATVSRNQLLRPFPQYADVNAFRVPFGFSIYHGGTLKADKRFSNGASLLVAYTWSKLIDDVSTTVGFLGQASARQNVFDRAAERAIGSQDISHRFVTSFVYDLPFGKGKRFGNNWHSTANRVIGGWQFNGVATFQSGLPILITQGANNVGLFNPTQRPTWNGNDPNREGSKGEKLAQWFDRSAFSITPAFTFGNTPRVMPNLRADGVKNFDLSLFKNNYFKEGKWNAQFRVEFFNAFNRTQFAPPGGQVDNLGSFGIVSSIAQGTSPRQIQLAIKLIM
jgi:hypothetical protein